MVSHDATARRVFGVTHATIVRRILATFDRATAGDLEAGARWYDEANAYAVEWSAQLDIPTERVAAVLSHLSPRQQWSRNVLAARALVFDGVRLPGIMGRGFDRANSAMDAHPDDVLDTFTGPKTRRFYLNILGDREAVTVDVWACRAAGIDELLLSRAGAYDAIEHAYRLAARRRGVDPVTMQATTWIVARNGRAS